MFKHILVPTDGSQFSQDTCRRAVSFAKEAGAKITAFYAKPEYPVTYYGEGALTRIPGSDRYRRPRLFVINSVLHNPTSSSISAAARMVIRATSPAWP